VPGECRSEQRRIWGLRRGSMQPATDCVGLGARSSRPLMARLLLRAARANPSVRLSLGEAGIYQRDPAQTAEIWS